MMSSPRRDAVTGRFLRLPIDPSLPLEKQLELETASISKRGYWRNRPKILAASRKYYWDNKPLVLKKLKKYRCDNKAEILERMRKRKYGVDEEFVQRLTAVQNGKCGICGKSTKRKLGIDHEHETKAIRGLLCKWCNTRLPWLEDKKWLAKALKYLGMETVELW